MIIRLSINDYMGNGESILVVDDVKEQREIASSILTKLGYHVTTVSSGEKAVEYLTTHSADLLVLDMIMDPGMDGLDTYRKVIMLHPGQKTIITSGYSETERVREAQRLGVGEYLKKPYAIEKFGAAVKKEFKKPVDEHLFNIEKMSRGFAISQNKFQAAGSAENTAWDAGAHGPALPILNPQTKSLLFR